MYYPTVGLEIHVELNTKTKMFCGCLNDADEKQPNVNICSVCTAQPGTLPVINKEAVKKVIKVGLALNSEIATYSQFDRKNYFYPDLPRGYQISQLYYPLCQGGFLNVADKKIRIKEIHLEEDTGKLIHTPETNYSLVDFNRAGVALMELVTEPDINSAEEAKKFAEELHLIIRYLNISDADMEKGQMRVEVNISLSQAKDKLGTKVEIKNLNSFAAAEKGIKYEIERQRALLEKGKKIIQETRGWDEVKEITVAQRKKETADDYRYFPDADLPSLHLSEEFLQETKAEIPELPEAKRKRLKEEYGLSEEEVNLFTYYRDLGNYFEKVISELAPRLSRDKLLRLIKLTANYLISDLVGLLKGAAFSSEKILINPKDFAEFITLIEEGEISSKIAKIVLEEMFEKGKHPKQIIEEKGLVQISDADELEKIVKNILKDNPTVVADYHKGKANALQFLVGRVMVVSKNKANPKIVIELLTKLLKVV